MERSARSDDDTAPGRAWAAPAGRAVRALALAGSVALAAAGGLPAGGAVPADRGAAAAGKPVMRAPDLETRAMLLLTAERRIYEPVSVMLALRAGPEIRTELAVALGRIPGQDARSVLAGLLIDDQAEVRREAAFSLGLRGEAEARQALRQAIHDPDRETGVLAVEALGRLATPLVEVAGEVAQLPEEERWPRLLPGLFRFKEAALVPLAEHGLGLPDPELHRQAAYALSRDPQPAAAPLLRRLLGDPDPLVRAWAARGLGRVGAGAADLAALAPLLADAAAGPVVEALRAGAALAAGDKAQAPSQAPKAPAASPGGTAPESHGAPGSPGASGSSAAPGGSVAGGPAATPDIAADRAWRVRLLELLADPRPGVRITAIEAAAAWLPDPGLGAALAAHAGGLPAAAKVPAGGPPAKVPPGAGARHEAEAAASGPAARQPEQASADRQATAPGGQSVRRTDQVAAADPLAAMARAPAAKVASGERVAAAAPAGAPDAVAAAIEQGTALVSLARGQDPRAAALTVAAAGSAEPRLRARAATAAALLGQAELMGKLAADRSPLVREAALTALLPAAPAPAAGSVAARGAGRTGAGGAPGDAADPAAARLAAAGLADRDEGVRTTACDWLADHPVVPLATLSHALGVALHDESIESPLGVIKALAARGEAEPRERGAIVELLEQLGKQPSYALRREAAAGLTRLGRPAPPPGPAPGTKAAGGDELRTYREIVERTGQPRTVEVRTNRGSFRLRLDCPRAPRTCLNFLALAGQHFYDGLLFHRVVPDFVIQAGDPRGDGFGGPGYTLADEVNRLRYRRGIIGMALAGPDTGGSQFFVTLSPQPHLDGGYTAFGEVVAGAEVLDAIQAGDRIASIVEVH